MSPPRYVCLSDLHLGAGYSMLAVERAADAAAGARPGPTLLAFGRALHETLRSFGDAPPPTLILLGDILDMGLSPMGAVAAAFRCFVEAVMLDGDRPVFAPRVLCVPGNHDHHLWRAAQDREFQDALIAGRTDDDLIEQTPLFESGAVASIGSPLLSRLMSGFAPLADFRVDIVYPNLGLLDVDRRRCVVLHHGHYVDALYRGMSTLNGLVPGHRHADLSVAQLERQNGAWVDFLWSDLGSSGAIGRDATTLYEVMRDGAASHRFCQRLSGVILASVDKHFRMSGSTPIVNGITLAELTLGALDISLGQGAASQRDSYLAVMTPGDVADLRWYLSGPVAQELASAGVDVAELDLSFVFGHTHKPFEDELSVPGFARPVGIFNTGGWVMDQPTMAAAQGTAAVFIDAAMNVASLRLFNDPLNGPAAPVSARGVGGFTDARNPMLAGLSAALPATAPAWAGFTSLMQQAVEKRAGELLGQFFPTTAAAPPQAAA
ncbi:MAG: hypothetical protein M3Z16_09565 [Pseudomonadota bacterium]|nr:hypothetical protein [Pseudomonadota bacterium]